MSSSSDVPVYKRRDGLDPVPELGRMSAQTPVFRDTGPGLTEWVAVGREEVRQILGDAERFSTRPRRSRPDLRQPTLEPGPGNLLQYDPPDHTRLRQLLTADFTLRRVRRLEPAVEKIVQDSLDVLERAGQPADLMRHFALPVAGGTGCVVLGMPRDDLPELSRLTDLRASLRSPRRVAAGKAFHTYMARLIARKRRDPGDDLLGALIQEHGAELTDPELVGICESVITAEVENAREMLGLGTLALLLHPDQLALLRERPELMDHAVDELLRFISVVPVVAPRTALVDVEVGGQTIKAGEGVACSVFAANRSRPPGEPVDGLDLGREPGNHLALGHGIHYCLGAALARMQLRIAFAGLLDRFPGLRLGGSPDELRYRLLAPQFGIETLPVAW